MRREATSERDANGDFDVIPWRFYGIEGWFYGDFMVTSF
jgi:hypothetical protein